MNRIFTTNKNGHKKKRVLIVDDQPRLLKIIEIKLKLSGYDVNITTSGREALELVKSAKPDVMLLDVIMPEMDGFEVLRNLRAFSSLPVIMFSAKEENAQEALRLGASKFLSKPFDPDELADSIDKLVHPGEK